MKANIKNDYDVFANFQKNENYPLYSLNRNDLAYFFDLLNKFYLEYKNFINIGSNILFGLELEYAYKISEYYNNDSIEKLKAKELVYWRVKPEPTVYLGGEVTSPILTDVPNSWDELYQICNLIKKYAIVNNDTGSHIHFDLSILKNDICVWLRFFKLWAAYEDVIYRFSYGENLNERSALLEYARPISNKLSELVKEEHYYLNNLINDLSCLLSFKEDALNFFSYDMAGNEYTKTIEVRVPNGTLNPIIWQNNVNFFAKLIQYTSSEKYNNDIIEARLLEPKVSKNDLEKYRLINTRSALELADLIFNNNEDKIYFLRQYFKNFEIANDNSYYLAKQFTVIR